LSEIRALEFSRLYLTSGSLFVTMLDSDLIAAFHRDGFVICRGLLSAAEIAAVATWTDELATAADVPGGVMKYYEDSLLSADQRILSRIENFTPYHTGFAALFDDPRLRGSCATLFGEDAVLFKDKINFKLPGGEGFKAHQDVQAGWNRYASLHISVLVCIDAATVENGCLELASGSHVRSLIGEMWAPLDATTVAPDQFTACPTAPGDVVFFDSFAPHRSGPNLTQAPRRVLYVTYNRRSEGDSRARYFADKRAAYPPDCERESGRDYVFRV
jgi:2-aminoethylphosphonate dioxygenase